MAWVVLRARATHAERVLVHVLDIEQGTARDRRRSWCRPRFVVVPVGASGRAVPWDAKPIFTPG
jgi:hypothetical protein